MYLQKQKYNGNDMKCVVSLEDVTGSDRDCQFYFMFYYISAPSVSHSKLYQQACVP